MNDLLLSPATKTQIKAFISKPSHALLISGSIGSGKAVVAKEIASDLLGLNSEETLENYPYFTHLKRPEGKQDISIEQVRNLSKLLKLKAPGTGEIRRIIIIEDAQDLNEEASNALLKMLEEPAADCVFLLSAPSSDSLLPTISSRAQQLQVRPVSLAQSIKYLGSRYKEADIESAWRLSQGAAGLMLAILSGDKQHPLKLAIDEAKGYLRKDAYERLLLGDVLSKDKKQLALLLEALTKLLGALQPAAVAKASDNQTKKILASRRLVLNLSEALQANASPKLITLTLSLNLL